jgi:hypothetical protein
MNIQQSLASERQHDRLRQASEQRSAQQAAELRRLDRRQVRAERELLRAWQRVEQLHSLRSEAS